MGTTVAIAGGPGGAGRSEVAAVLARAAAALGRRVVAVDAAEGEGPLGMLLGLDPRDAHDRMDAWAAAVAAGPVSNPGVIDNMLAPTASGVRQVRGLGTLGWSLPEPELLGRVIESLAAVADLIVVDCPGLPTAAALGAWRAADAIVLVTGPKPSDLYVTQQAAHAVGRPVSVLLNCAHGEPRPEAAEMAAALDLPVLGTVPWDRALAGGCTPRALDGPFARAVRATLDPLARGIAPVPQPWWRRRLA